MITQENITTGVYFALVYAGVITVLAGLFVYFYKKSRHNRKSK